MNCLYRLMNTVSTKVFQKTKVLPFLCLLCLFAANPFANRSAELTTKPEPAEVF